MSIRLAHRVDATTLPLLADDDLEVCCAPLTGRVIDQASADRPATMFKALRNPTRVRLSSMIAAAQGGEACICELTAPVGLSQGPPPRTHLAPHSRQPDAAVTGGPGHVASQRGSRAWSHRDQDLAAAATHPGCRDCLRACHPGGRDGSIVPVSSEARVRTDLNLVSSRSAFSRRPSGATRSGKPARLNSARAYLKDGQEIIVVLSGQLSPTWFLLVILELAAERPRTRCATSHRGTRESTFRPTIAVGHRAAATATTGEVGPACSLDYP